MTTHSRELSGNRACQGASPDDTTVSVATSLDEVIEAWSLVYAAYRRTKRIVANRWQLHTVPQTISPNSAVILGRTTRGLVNTMTVHFDGAEGLSLDSIYKAELDQLRHQGRKLVEVGLFADRRRFNIRSIRSLLQLMRLAWYYATGSGITDGVIGVHPRHATFYSQWLGFEPFGPRKHYELVNAPTVLLRLDWKKALGLVPMPRGYPIILSSPLDLDHFRNRFRLSSQAISGSIIDEFLRASFAVKL